MLIISASNVSTSREKSKSLQVATKIKNGLNQIKNEIEIIDLRDFQLSFCIMCEKCNSIQKCVQDNDFNEIFEKWKKHDQIILVVPHYALIPSKLLCMFEKIQEIYYLNYCSGKQNNQVKNVMIIAHGGMTENFEDVYMNNIIKPLKGIIESIGSKVENDIISKDLCFGVKKYFDTKDINSLCIAKEDDEEKENGRFSFWSDEKHRKFNPFYLWVPDTMDRKILQDL